MNMGIEIQFHGSPAKFQQKKSQVVGKKNNIT